MFLELLHSKWGGEFGFTGLFDSHKLILEKWDKLVFPALIKCSLELTESKAPILQRALINQAPCFIIKDIVEHLGFVNIKDSRGRYPIDVANELELGWDKGMKEIVDTFAYAQGINPVIMSAKYGLTWENSMKNVVEESEIGIIQGKEEFSGLYPFMLAGVGMKYDWVQYSY